MKFYQLHSAIEIEAKQLTQHDILFFREKRADQFPAVGARSAKELGSQIVLLLTGDFRLDRHYLRS